MRLASGKFWLGRLSNLAIYQRLLAEYSRTSLQVDRLRRSTPSTTWYLQWYCTISGRVSEELEVHVATWLRAPLQIRHSTVERWWFVLDVFLGLFDVKLSFSILHQMLAESQSSGDTFMTTGCKRPQKDCLCGFLFWKLDITWAPWVHEETEPRMKTDLKLDCWTSWPW